MLKQEILSQAPGLSGNSLLQHLLLGYDDHSRDGGALAGHVQLLLVKAG